MKTKQELKLAAFLCLLPFFTTAQVYISNTNGLPQAGAMLQVHEGTNPATPFGFLLPRFDATRESNRPASPAEAIMYYSFAQKKFVYFDLAGWTHLNPWTINPAGSLLYFSPAGAFKVGIGTGNPQSILDVSGGLSVGAGYAGVNASPANGALFEGNVAIGKITAATTLDVNGTITSTGLQVNSTDAVKIPAGTNAQRPGSPSTGMIRFNSDVNSLEFYDGQVWVSALPPGTIVAFGGATVPAGWLLCDGALVLRTAYPKLFNAIGTAWGTTLGTNFNLPDLRGKFLRGVDDVAGAGGFDPDDATRTAILAGGNTGNTVGSYQGDATAVPNTPYTTNNTGNHTHWIANDSGVGGILNDGPAGSDWDGLGRQHSPGLDANNYILYGNGATANIGRTNSVGNHTHTISGGDNESRPKNAYVNYIIKY